MKVVVRLAIVVAVLLLVSNMAFATCTNRQTLCYSIVATDQNGNTFTDSWFVELCDEGVGDLYSYLEGLPYYSLYLFGGGPSWFNTTGNPMFGGHPYFTSWIADKGTGNSGYLQPMGAGKDLLTGEGHQGSKRWTISGKKVPLSNCP